MSAAPHRVLITGMGGICSLGANCRDIFDATLLGQSFFQPPPDAISKWLPHTICAPVPDEQLKPKLAPSEMALDRAVQFALIASQEAIVDAALHSPEPHTTGVFCGIGMGGNATTDSMYAKFFETVMQSPGRNPTVVHPLSIPRLMPNAAAAAISMKYGLKGTSNTYTVACASSATALGEAFRSIKHGYAKTMVVVGTEAMLTPGAFVAWNALRVMAKPRSDDIAASCRPFSLSRTGFVIGEGAACLVLEAEESARQRGATVYAELAGYGTSSDAQHLTAPSVEGQAEAMRAALSEAGLTPSELGYINAHGTATDIGDVTEARSIRQAFGAATDAIHVSSTKSMHGHLIGAAGTLELMLAVKALQSGSIPPTAYLNDLDPECALSHVALKALHNVALDAVMSNSFAFGGSNVSLIAKRFIP